MVSGGVHAPEDVVQTEGEPGHGDVVAELGRGEHPLDLRPAESPVALVEREVVEIVPGHEPVPERGHEGGQGQGDEQGRRRPAHPSLGRGRLWALIVHGVAFEQATSSGGAVASVFAIRRRLSQASRDVGDTRRAITKALRASTLRLDESGLALIQAEDLDDAASKAVTSLGVPASAVGSEGFAP